MRGPIGPAPGALRLLLSLFVLIFPMIVTMILWLETGVWWRFAVVTVLTMGLIYWQMFRIFQAQDRAAIQRIISQ